MRAVSSMTAKLIFVVLVLLVIPVIYLGGFLGVAVWMFCMWIILSLLRDLGLLPPRSKGA